MAEKSTGWLSRLTPTRGAWLRERGEALRRRTRRDAGPQFPVPAVSPLAPVAAAEENPGGVPASLRGAAAWSWRLIVIAAAALAVGWVIAEFRIVVVPFVIALLLAVLLDPVAAWLRRRLRFPRTLAAAVTLVGALAAIVGLLVAAGRSIAIGFADLADQAVAGFNELLTWMADGPLHIDQTQLDDWISQGVDQVTANSGVLVSGVISATASATQVITGMAITLFCLFFFLREGRRIWQWFIRLAPRLHREKINEAGIRGWVSLGAYARTQILVAFVDAVGIGVGAWILGVPLALPIGVLVFLGAFIPIIGAFVSGSVAVLVALVDSDITTALLMLGVILLVQQVEGNVLQPWLMGNALSLHPVAVLLAVIAGTGLAGILGALLAVPIAAVINTVVLYLHGHDKYPSLATDWYRPGGPPGALLQAIEESFGPKQVDEGRAREHSSLSAASPGTAEAHTPDDVGEDDEDGGEDDEDGRGAGRSGTDGHDDPWSEVASGTPDSPTSQEP